MAVYLDSVYDCEWKDGEKDGEGDTKDPDPKEGPEDNKEPGTKEGSDEKDDSDVKGATV